MGEVVVEKSSSRKRFLSDSTLVSILLIAVSLMTFMTVKKFLDVGMVVTPTQAMIKKLTKEVNNNPGSLEARLRLAYAFQQANQFEDAEKQYNEVLKADPENQTALYNLADMAWVAQREEEAVQIFKELLEKHPGHVLGSVKIGNIYIRQGKYDDAIKVADTALLERSGVIELHMIKAKALEAKQEYDKAVDQYQEVLRYVPDYKEALDAIDRIY